MDFPSRRFLWKDGDLKDGKLLKTGIVGTVVTAVCCFTPALVILMGLIGLSAWTGMLDMVLFPLLGLFLAIMVFAILRKKKAA